MIDLRKAFDLVDHPTLLLKLSLYGLGNKALPWFCTYPINREFQEVIDSQFSNKATIISGVPQGSILDPLLFILYMNDLPLHLSETQIDLYADDATQYVSGSNIQVVEEKLTRDILPIIQWSEMNKMVLNERRPKLCLLQHR